MPVNVNGVSGQKGSVASSNGPTMLIEDGKVVIKFNNKKYSLTKQEAEQYCEVLYNINYARNKVDDLKNKLASKKISEEDKQKYSAELSKWNEKYVKQQEAANFEISPNGDVVAFTMKKDIPAETFKELFSIEDGAFRGYLKKEALKDGIGVEKDDTGDQNNEAGVGICQLTFSKLHSNNSVCKICVKTHSRCLCKRDFSIECHH